MKVFDWKIQPIAELDYTLVETGGTGGINGGIVEAAEVVRGRGCETSSAGTAKYVV
jgi:hypothetical protein